jgi:hypothetical protein
MSPHSTFATCKSRLRFMLAGRASDGKAVRRLRAEVTKRDLWLGFRIMR